MDTNTISPNDFTIDDYKKYQSDLPYYSYKPFRENKTPKCKGCSKITLSINIDSLCNSCSFDKFKNKHWNKIKDVFC